MHWFQLLSVALFVPKTSFIQNVEFPSCKDCVHYKPKPYSRILHDNSTYARCSLFGNKDVISGKVSFEYASVCRSSEVKCSINGNHFTPIVNSNAKNGDVSAKDAVSPTPPFQLKSPPPLPTPSCISNPRKTGGHDAMRFTCDL